jgi:outer membrane protein OmpA-like peptidoglycan-associated protein
MNLHYHYLSLAPSWADEDDARQIVLVEAIDALWMCRDGEYETVPAWEVIWELERQGSSLTWQIRNFASQSNMMGMQESWLRDDEMSAKISFGINRGELVGIRRKQSNVAASKDPVVEQQRLVRDLESKTRGRLSEGGRQFKLVAGADLPGIPDRNSYEVVSNQEARRVLGTWVEQAGTRADLVTLFGKARDMLSPDWRPPLAAKGVVLLRKILAMHVVSVTPGAAITPSQMRAMAEAERPLQFFARFVDEHGKPVTGVFGKFEHGADPEEDMAFSGSEFTRMGEYKGDRQAWLTIAEKNQQKLIDELKKRWQQVRGEPDNEWKKKEEALVEVFLKEGEMLELQLEAEKKHTFMLRPPVALAHMHGMYFDTNKCFLLPTSVPSLKELVALYAKHAGSEVLVVGHADTAGIEDDNLGLSAERADTMKAFLSDDADAWLAWYEEDIPKGKRWGKVEDYDMIDALVPRFERRSARRVLAYQKWHNAQKDVEGGRKKPEGWEALEPDGVMNATTRRQLVLDYMNLDGTSLPKGTRVVTYGCGEFYPLYKEEGEPDPDTENNKKDGKHVRFNRRVELFFFDKPFGILPAVPGVAEGASSETASQASKGDNLYPEWRIRAMRKYMIDGPEREIALIDELGLPLCGRKVRIVVPTKDDIETVSDDEGKIRVRVPPGCEFDLVIDNIHEGGIGDSLQTESGLHFGDDADGPEVEA